MAKASPEQLAEQIAAHTVYYASSKCAIKDDVAQLAVFWKTGSGPLTKQEAGLLLWYHSQRGQDGAAEVLGADVLTTCLDTLSSSTALSADKSTAAGLLMSLCAAGDAVKEQVAKGKASTACGGSSCCQVLHGCLTNPAAVPRHVAALLACLAGNTTSLSVLLKALVGAVPWGVYINLLAYSHKTAKDHTTAVDTCKLIQQLVSGRAVLAADAAAAGVLEALQASMAAHKSAAAVCAGASCLLAMCLAAPDLREQLGRAPGAMQQVVDLLGPPPTTVIAWEQQQLQLQQAAQQQQQQLAHQQQQHVAPNAAMPAGGDDSGGRRSPHPASSSTRAPGSSTGSVTGGGGGSQHVRLSEIRVEGVAGRSRTGFAAEVQEGDSPPRELREEQGQSMTKTRRKSLRILGVAEGEPAMSAAAHTSSMSGADATSPSLRSKSLLGCLKPSSTGAHCSKAASWPRNAAGPTLRSPPLSTNSTALKWDAPVTAPTRAAAAGLLAQLVQLPQLREAACERLAAPRLAVLLNTTMQELAAAGKKGKPGGKKGGGKLALTPDAEQLLTHACVCLEFLVAGDNADCYRVAAAGCLPSLVQLAGDSRNTQLRRAAKAVVAQVVLLGEGQQYVQQAEVPEELTALPEGSQVLMRLRDLDIRQLLVEVPSGGALHALDEVTARART